MSKSLQSVISFVELTNVFSYEHARFEFGTGVTLIEGYNHDDGTPEGSGKSAIPNAMCWGLFGKIPKDAKVDDVIREGTESCSVVVGLRDGTEIHRTRKPNDLYLVTSDGKQAKGKDARETQGMVEAALGMSFETCCQAVYFAQNYPAKFISATEAERAKILSEIQDLEDFTLAKKKVQGLLRAEELGLATLKKDVETQGLLIQQAERQLHDFLTLREAARSEQERNLTAYRNQVNALEEELAALIKEHLHTGSTEALSANLAEVSADIAAIQKQINDLQVEVGAASEASKQKALNVSDLARKAAEEERVRKEIEQTRAQIDATPMAALGAQEKEIAADLQALEEARAEAKARLTSVEEAARSRATVQGHLSRKQAEFQAASRKVGAFRETKEKLCPTCGAPMSAAHAAQHLNEQNERLEQLMGEIDGFKAQLDAMGEAKDASAYRAELSELEISIQGAKNLRTSIDSTRKKVDFAIRNVEVLEARLQSIGREKTALQSRIDSIVIRDVTELSAQVAELNTVLGAAREMETALKADLAAAQEADRSIALKKRDLARVQKSEADEAAKDTSILDDKIETLSKEIEAAEAKAKSVSEELTSKLKRAARLETLKDAFQEVKQFVFKGLLSELSKKANKYLVELFDVPVSIRFSNDGEDGETSKIEVLVTIYGKERALGLYSGGQFRRISLAVDLALSDIISGRSHNAANLRIFDEPFKDLSEASMERALKLFETLPGCSVLIEHNSMVKSIVNKSYRVELNDKVSRVVE